MKPLAARDPFKIGIAAIAVGAVVGLLVLLFSVVSFGTTTYTAYLAQTAGLRAGEDVKVHGVPVGKVTGISLNGSQVKVEFTVKDDVELGNRTTAAVQVATLLGTHVLAIDPAGTGSIRSIPLDRTSVPFNLQDVLEKGTANLEKLDAALLARALNETSKTLDASSENLGPALVGVARLSEAITRRSDQTGQLLTAARGVTEQLAASSGDIVVLMEQANLVLGEITSRRAAIRTLLVETTTLSRNLADIIEQTEKDTAPALRQLNRVVKTLRDQDAVLKKTLEQMAPTLRYFANATGNGPWADLYLQSPGFPPDDLRCRLGDC